MTYAILPPSLHATADAIADEFPTRWGIAKGRIGKERPISNDMGFVTTLSATTADHHYLCVEVSTRAYPPALDAFVLDAKNQAIPLRLFVAFPSDGVEGDFKGDLSRAVANGVGVIEVKPTGVVVLTGALSLSLTGLRDIPLKNFPLKYRQSLSSAISTFRSGNPEKGCLTVYEEIESLTRRIGARCEKAGSWKRLGGTAPPKFKEKDPWASVARLLREHLDSAALHTPGLDEQLLSRVHGITSHRNDVGHKPESIAKRRARDQRLRTRFEAAVDLLTELNTAAKPLRI